MNNIDRCRPAYAHHSTLNILLTTFVPADVQLVPTEFAFPATRLGRDLDPSCDAVDVGFHSLLACLCCAIMPVNRCTNRVQACSVLCLWLACCLVLPAISLDFLESTFDQIYTSTVFRARYATPELCDVSPGLTLRCTQLPQDAKAELPLWLVEPLVNRGMVVASHPKIYAARVQRKMEAGAQCMNIRTKAPYFYTVGLKVNQL